VQDNFFSPRDITISVGDSVTWSFDGSALHTVTEGAAKNPPAPLFDSGLMRSGTFGYRFTSAGSFPYHCDPHFAVDMKGTVTVEP
jgi:plastocyanin